MSMSFRNQPVGPVRSGSPKDGHERSVVDREGVNHLEVFMNGSWRHLKSRCKATINPNCTRWSL